MRRVRPPDSLFADLAALETLCWRFHVRRLSLLGSTLKGTTQMDSDIDLLVEFKPGREPGLIALGDLEAQLSALVGDLLDGRCGVPGISALLPSSGSTCRRPATWKRP